jgi:transcriptional regulator with XRE-family HTH domain
MAGKTPGPLDKHVASRVRMRRMMLAMSQEKLGDALGITFQQVQKYERGANRIGGSRLHHIASILQVPVTFFFEGAPNPDAKPDGVREALSPNYVSDFLATSEGFCAGQGFQPHQSAEAPPQHRPSGRRNRRRGRSVGPNIEAR